MMTKKKKKIDPGLSRGIQKEGQNSRKIADPSVGEEKATARKKNFA